mmetsp:Transcript_40035/g.110243  ORF Transcript_40035/g.110243 Transcript_40035/m.110243 type:complete len:103 (+) Transcript_40035:260-568(+)
MSPRRIPQALACSCVKEERVRGARHDWTLPEVFDISSDEVDACMRTRAHKGDTPAIRLTEQHARVLPVVREQQLLPARGARLQTGLAPDAAPAVEAKRMAAP